MAKESAGILMFRKAEHGLEVLLVHPGGPFFANKDLGAWTIPKGEPDPDEPLQTTARREFQEEVGITLTTSLIPLGSIKQKGGKVVHAWAAEGTCDPSKIQSNMCVIEWPPRSGKQLSIPEIDRAEFFTLEQASLKINPAQAELLSRLTAQLGQP